MKNNPKHDGGYHRYLHAGKASGIVRLAALAGSMWWIATGGHTFAQSFTGFTPGNLVVSESQYQGTSSSVPFPGTLPNGTASTANGTYPSVFNNETPDPSFGITSPIFLDEISKSGTLITSLNVTNAVSTQLGMNLSTSFPSKSELAINLTPDGTGLTFMGYTAAINQLDISNSNTPGFVDPTNPVTAGVQASGTNPAPGAPDTQRAVALVDYAGNVNVNPTNAYSGNNGRAAVLGSNGNYYMVGNAGNGGSFSLNGATTVLGSGTVTATTTAGLVAGELVTGTNISGTATITSVIDSTHFVINQTATRSGTDTKAKIAPSGTTLGNLSNDTGVQMISSGSTGNTTVVGQVNGTFGSTTGYQRGFSAASTDKTGKDDNFRGLTLNPFNNTLYVTKGSGGNGVNSVYQVGAGGLPSLTDAASTAITILAGFPTAGTTTNPFGLWFATATTLYVADEGNGTTTDANAGLEKWVFNGSTWVEQYTIQTGLIGNQYDVVSGSGTIHETLTGLRNITGQLNGDGTVTIYAITATTSSLTDVGADPNQVVAITDTLSGTSLASGNDSVGTVETASYGQVLRGVSLSPIPEPSTWAMLVLGAAGFTGVVWRRRAARKV